MSSARPCPTTSTCLNNLLRSRHVQMVKKLLKPEDALTQLNAAAVTKYRTDLMYVSLFVISFSLLSWLQHHTCRAYYNARKFKEKGCGPCFHEDYRLTWAGEDRSEEGFVAAFPFFSVLWSAAIFMTTIIYVRLVHP